MPKKLGKIKIRNRNLPLVYELIYELGGLFGRECEVCGRKMRKPMSGFTIHHLTYRKGEKTHRDFSSRLEYYRFLTKILQKFHKQNKLSTNFAFLCNACHHSIDGPRGLNRRKRINVLRLFLMYFRTNT
jgi:hypothetical protein